MTQKLRITGNMRMYTTAEGEIKDIYVTDEVKATIELSADELITQLAANDSSTTANDARYCVCASNNSSRRCVHNNKGELECTYCHRVIDTRRDTSSSKLQFDAQSYNFDSREMVLINSIVKCMEAINALDEKLHRLHWRA